MTQDAIGSAATFGRIPATATGTTDAADADIRSERRAHPIGHGLVAGRYQIRHALGAGGMGQVWLARDTVLGRSVALKLVRHERVGRLGTEQFVEEARATAALNHPHVVQLYDVGEHDGEPYLALEYVEGETLHERMARARLSIDEGLRVLRAIADALRHAHQIGIHHCDLKPGNVMIGRDGRLRVVDFGLAHQHTSPTGVRAGTPDWMAPEQWRGDALTDRVDVWALGVLAHRLLGGGHPFGDDSERREATILDASHTPAPLLRAEVPLPVADLVARSLDRAPGNRPSAAEWHQVIDGLLEGRAMLAGSDGPYRGLAAFEERHTRFFFGREQETDAFVERLRDEPLLPVVGPSGVGKSSFLYAGVLPRLRAREPWTVIALRPGPDPVMALARQVLAAGLGTPDGRDAGLGEPMVRSLAGELRETPTLLAARLSTIGSVHGGRVLLAIDQMEELFTQGATDADVRAFLALVDAAVDDPGDPVRVVLTIRDDFLGRVPGVRSLFVLRRMDGGELRRTILGPLERCGHRLDDDSLVDDMLAELGPHAHAGLPMLQFACRALWDARDPDRRELRRADHDRLGGVAGALATHADGVLAQLGPDEQRLARQLLLAMVAGTTRRAVPRGVLLHALPPRAAHVLDRLLAARLLVQRTPGGEQDIVVEIAHESLLRTWEQLARWIDESRDERRLLSELDEAASLWHRRGRRLEETWSAQDLATTRHRIDQLAVAVPDPVAAFLGAGESRHREARRRSRRRTWLATAIGVVITTASLGVAREYRAQKLEAERQARALALAGGNLGRVDLALTPFDWRDDRPHPVDAAALPGLTVGVHGVGPGDPHRPGAPLPAEQVRFDAPTRDGLIRIEHLQAPGGTAFLRLDGRGRTGETCAPSWIRIQQLPGYAERDSAVARLVIHVPTCQASAADAVVIPAGPFIYGGPGAPATRFDHYLEPERVEVLPSFAIDRTEVSNARFAPFGDMHAITGYPRPAYPRVGVLEHAHDPEMPVTALDAFAAEAFCRFLGKRLPGDLEWTKAARGGTTLDGAPNPHPRRLYPWGEVWDPRCANAEGADDGFRWTAPVTSMACGASPYGVLHMAGNAAEWIAREGQNDRDAALRVFRGGAIDSPVDREQTTTVFRNSREDRSFDFTTGVRCVAGPSVAADDVWSRP